MNREKFENKIDKRYGVTSSELADKTVKEAKELKEIKRSEKKAEKKGISNLKVSDNIKKNKLGKYVLKTFSGASTGIAIAEGINYWFPALVPSITSYYTGLQAAKMSAWEQALIVLGAASKPAVEISHLTIVGVGALVGALLYNGYALVKKGINHHSIKSDINTSRKLHH